jgi:hypothetical protein
VRERHCEQYRQQGHRHQQEGFAWPARTAVDVENMARDAFARIDEIHDNNNNANDEAGMDAAFAEVEAQFNEANLEHMIRESTETVYEGSSQNRLQCAIVLFSLCTLYSVPHTFLDALLTWIAGDLLPTSNKFLRTAYEVKSLLMRLGLKHDQIHCCPDGHVLYEGDNAELDECPTCHQQRYIPGSNNVPQRVARYFDVIKHLQRMFKSLKWLNT